MEIHKYEKLVTNFELSKKLEKAGYPQKTLFYWITEKNEEKRESLITADFVKSINRKFIAAPTLSEILEKIEDFTLYKRRKEEEPIFSDKYCIINGPLAFYMYSSNDILITAASNWLLRYGKKDEK